MRPPESLSVQPTSAIGQWLFFHTSRSDRSETPPRNPNLLAAKTPAMRANAKMRLLMLAAATSIDGVCNRKRGPRARGCMKSIFYGLRPTMSKHAQLSCFLCRQVENMRGAGCPISWASPWSPSLGPRQAQPGKCREEKGTGPRLPALKLFGF